MGEKEEWGEGARHVQHQHDDDWFEVAGEGESKTDDHLEDREEGK